MTAPAPLRGATSRLVFWALVGIALLVAHDAVYVAQIGPGADLARTLRSAAHDYWGAASGVLVAGGVVAALAVLLRIRRLRRRARELGVEAARPSRAFRLRALSLWSRLFAVVAIGFAFQENVEHLVGHAHLIGTGALFGPEYPLALPVIGLITLLAALMGAAIITVERDLLASIVAALARSGQRPPRRTGRAPGRIDVTRIPLLARPGASRAPPAMLEPAL